MASHTGSTRLGGQAFNHGPSSDAEAEYDRLRELARKQHEEMSSCFDRAHKAYESGDGAEAKQLSEQGKEHQAKRDQLNKQASEFIFRENNAQDRVDADTIDLHGQFVEEAEEILEKRIKSAKAQGQTHLHVIVGKGNHSPDHIQKIKPAVEKLCREEGLQFKTEENEGRIYVNLQGGPADQPPPRPEPIHSSQPGTHTHSQPQQQFESNEIQENKDPLANCLKGCCVVM